MLKPNFLTEKALDDEFIRLMRIVNIFQSRHGVEDPNYIQTLNFVRKGLLERIGWKTPYTHALQPWTTHQEDILIELHKAEQPIFKISQHLGRSVSAIEAKLSNLKFKSILANYDQIIMDLATEVAEEFDVSSDWFLEKADSFWKEKAIEDLKTKVVNLKEKKEKEVA